MSEEKKVRSTKRSRNIFEAEFKVLSESKEFLTREDITLEECKSQLLGLQKHYDELLDQSKLITKVSDRLQKKINNTNDELESKNILLQDSLDALTKARVGRRATTITLIIVIVLFLFTEAIIEPKIDIYAERKFAHIFANAELVFSLGAKVIIALLLRPIEKIVERTLMKREAEKLKKEKQSNSIMTA